MKKRIAILDDDPYWLADLRSRVQKWFPSIAIDYFLSVNGFYAQLHKGIKFHVVIVDGNIGGDSGIVVTRTILDVSPDTCVIGYSGDPKNETSFLDAGAELFINKTDYSKSLHLMKDLITKRL